MEASSVSSAASSSASSSAASGETDLTVLLRLMQPELVPGDWFFATLPFDQVVYAAATVREPEGLSVVIGRAEAERICVATSHAYAWITLRVHSSLDAVGLTAAVSAALTEHGISCNVIAGARHDHLLVPVTRAGDAVRALVELSQRS